MLRLHSPLGENVLLAGADGGKEACQRLFAIELAVRAKRDVKPDELIGKLIDVEIEVAVARRGNSLYRPLNGLVTDLNEGPPVTRGLRSYRLTLRPQLWLLSQRSTAGSGNIRPRLRWSIRCFPSTAFLRPTVPA